MAHYTAAVQTMNTVLFITELLALALDTAVPQNPEIKLKAVTADFVNYQKKILVLIEHPKQLDTQSEYYKLGKEYNIEANINNYSNKTAVENFLVLYRTGFLPKYHKFSIFYERMRNEAIALFHIMYYAKDFVTFYKTAAWAKVYLNDEQFIYAYRIAVVQRADTTGIVLPAPYEVYPEFFINKEVLFRMYRTKMQGGLFDAEASAQYGIVKENDYYVYYANYSNSLTYPNQEQKLSYFTEDIGWNSYLYYFHSHLPFWWKSEKLNVTKDRLGELFFCYYKKLLARYSLERVSNGLGKIPEFSWHSNFKTGYHPQLTGNYLPFAQRSNDYNIQTEKNNEFIRFLDTYEERFLQFSQKDKKTPENEMNYVNYWPSNEDLYSEHSKNNLHQYEIVARQVLGGSPKPIDNYTFMPTALDFYETSMRDPAFYQFYQRMFNYLIAYKEYVKPYSHNDLHFDGVEISNVIVSELATFFNYFDFNAKSSVFFSQEELKSYPSGFIMRQPRLNNKPFTVTVDIRTGVSLDAVLKIFVGPPYNTNGSASSKEEEWMKFYELDWSVQKLVPGENKIERKSSEFVFFKDDSIPINHIYQWLDQEKVPYDMSTVPENMPRRLMLPKGTPGGSPFQLVVFAYPYNSVKKEASVFGRYILDNKPFGYPFDRPMRDDYSRQPNMYFKDIKIDHQGAYFPHELNVPSYFTQKKQ